MFYKKRPLVEFEDKGQALRCDNESCGFVYELDGVKQTNPEGLNPFIGHPCPDCGQNLLTEDDFNRAVRLIGILKWMNKWLSWTTVFVKPSEKNVKKVRVSTHKELKIEKIEDESQN